MRWRRKPRSAWPIIRRRYGLEAAQLHWNELTARSSAESADAAGPNYAVLQNALNKLSAAAIKLVQSTQAVQESNDAHQQMVDEALNFRQDAGSGPRLQFADNMSIT